MNAEKQRIAIAVKLGLTCELCREDPGSDLWSCGCWLSWPDYPNDLNAVHEAENTLDGSNVNPQLRYTYADYLYRIVVPENRQPFRATAAQRCEALLRTWGLWEEEK